MDGLQSFYWQFARSRLDSLDIMRFGQEFATFKARNVRVLLNATVTQIGLTADGGRLDKLDISTLGGVRSSVRAKVAVIAASGIENPRLLLASNSVQGRGVGNAHDQVGRFLMDHPGAQVGRFHHEAIAPIVHRFGFYGIRDRGRAHLFMHGLTISPVIQERERLVNCAIYFMPERSSNDPWDALKRLLRSRSDHPFRDALSLVSGGGLLAKGACMKILGSSRTPRALKELIVDTAIRCNPNFVAADFQSGGLPHKLTGVSMEAIVEQRPNPNSRVTLSDKVDQLGVPLAKVDWCIDDDDRFAIVRIAQLAQDILPRAGLPEPVLEPWVAENRLEQSIVIDMAHTLGTTRMSDDPKTSVVDRYCKVHGVHGLYIAGGSVFPTSGHANPTLMILSLAIRLADTIKSRL
jgi:choline dehydrogenase-like flavoprotein